MSRDKTATALLDSALDIVRQLVAAIPMAWRWDAIFRWSAGGCMVTFVFLLLGLTGPRQPLPPNLAHDTAPRLVAASPSPAVSAPPSGLQSAPGSPAVPPSASTPPSPVIAPGRPLGAAPAAADTAGSFGTMSARRPN